MRSFLLPLTLALPLTSGLVLVPTQGRAMFRAPSPGDAASRLVIPAADARHPYSNVDRRVDAGNDTGDAQTERLNEEQLSRLGQQGAPSLGAAPPAGPYAAPPGYAPPSEGYGAPPAYAPPSSGYPGPSGTAPSGSGY